MSAILCSYNQFQDAPRKSREVLTQVQTSILAKEVVRLMGTKFGCDLMDQANWLINNFPRVEFRRRLNERVAKIAIMVVIAIASALFTVHFCSRGYNVLHYWNWYAVPLAGGILFIWFCDCVLEKEWVNFFLGKDGGHLLEPFLIEYDRKATEISLAYYAHLKYREFVGEVQQAEEFKQRFEENLNGIALRIVTFQKQKQCLGIISEVDEQVCRQLGSDLRNWAYDASEWLKLISGDITPYFKWAEAEWKRKAEKGEIALITNYQI